jgi:NAD(P)H-dependent FMN reductase
MRRDAVSVPRLLIVHHTPSPVVHSLLDACRSGATDPAIEGVEVVLRAALAATPIDVLEADGYLLVTPANLGYVSGALKHFFDQIYYPCLEDTVGRPFGLLVHGSSDTTGAVKAVEKITTGLRWNLAQPVLELTGAADRAALDQAWELGAGLGAMLAEGLA